ncbi:GNAT family N-acetyltransferase [Janthinobacterium fluminis]|uniref:GNAT family protein n=1 Tax=Janthinobacterium fluminis TaxID=2987524 RepID=A0ABT5JV75_9BURK|nr:GNAT family protein [Janthinobacterium fluminis]MDC8756315.1 GNAT family protein [Janthinobacterium fluminis]
MPTSTAASLQIFPPTLADAEELLAFESDNRAYFESWINARSDGYYHIAAVRAAIEQAARERDNDVAYQFLAKVGGRIVGRVNLTAVVRRYFNKAALGYRIAEQAGGQGYASRAVELAVREGFGAIGLWRIEADVRAANTGSQRVMERNDFRLYGKSARSMRMHGSWHDVLHFERRRDEEPSSFDDVDALLPASQR